MRLKSGWTILMIVFPIFLIAQWKDIGLSMPTPNAASLGLYGEMPVSYFTGVPNISIPLYEIRGNKISLPLSLSYHAGGLRPDVHPGWVGNGWSLNAGGVITRKVNGNSDERIDPSNGKIGYYFNHSNLDNTNWSTPPKITNWPSYPPITPYGNNQYFDGDTEPDEFDFNFQGYSGKFFLDQTGKWQVQCDKAVKIVFDSTDFVDPFTKHINFIGGSQYQTFGKFTIVDEYGNQYIFGSKDSYNTGIEFSDLMIFDPNLGFGNSIVATSWYLTQIISADGTEVINLNFERGPLTSQISFSSDFGGFYQPNGSTGSSLFNLNNYYPGCEQEIKSTSFSGWVLFPVYLKSIEMPCKNLIIDFSNKSKSSEMAYDNNPSSPTNAYYFVYHDPTDPSHLLPSVSNGTWDGCPTEYLKKIPSTIQGQSAIPFYANNPSIANDESNGYTNRFVWLKLDAIQIKNKLTNNLLKSINLNYINPPTKRLQLKSLNISDANNQTVENYSFDYNNQTELPAYLSTYTDHWGFNNNVPLNFPAIDPRTDFYSKRIPDVTGIQTQAEILTSITYPTGGKVNFYYETNTYGSVVYRDPNSYRLNNANVTVENGIGGGLRIKQIQSIDNFNKSIIRNFYYVKGFSYGLDPSTLVSSGVLDTKPNYSFSNQFTTPSGVLATYTINSSNSVIPVTSNSAGTLIGYSSVIEQRTDGSYSLYEFTNQDNNLYADRMPTAVVYAFDFHTFPCSSLAFERGQLLHEATFALKNNNQYLVEEKINQYSEIGSNSANALYNNPLITCGTGVANVRSAYYLYSFPFLLTNQTEKLYNNDASGTAVVQSTSFTYDQYKNVVQQQSTNSKGQTELVTYTYPYAYISNDPSNPYSAMAKMNNTGTPIEKRVSVNANLVNGELHTYKYIGLGKVYNDAIYNYESAVPVALNTISTTSISAGKLSFDNKYVKNKDIYYDASGNISTINNTGNYPECYIWDYGQQLPVCKVANAKNIYTSGVSDNVSQAFDNLLDVPFSSLNTTLITSISVASPGTVHLTFTYGNPYISGNNYSGLVWSLVGDNTYSGYLCGRTNSATGCGSTSNAATITVVPGVYTLKYTLISYSGFQNYYGYSLDVNYSTNTYAVINGQSDIAYTSFESDGKGNWTFSGASVDDITAPTGKKAYSLSNGGLTRSNLDVTKTYIVSYWSKNGQQNVTGTSLVTAGRSLGSWVYYEHTVINPSGGAISVSGTGLIDEIRLYPSNAQMTTFTYDPLIGLTSQCDPENKIVYYEYDSFGRLNLIRDQDRNIIKKYCYNYAGQTENCN